MDGLWMGLGWVLGGFWMGYGWVLDGFWMSFGWVMDGFVMGCGWVLDGFFVKLYRLHAMQNYVKNFCQSHSKNVQIISLGAGFDTRPFQEFYQSHVSSYIEFDFPDVVKRKKEGLQNNGFIYPEGIDSYYKIFLLSRLFSNFASLGRVPKGCPFF